MESGESVHPRGGSIVPEPSEDLESWLAEQEREFPAWTTRYGAGGDWDFSPTSVDALAEAVFRETPTAEQFEDPANCSFTACAEWYWGEVLRRATPSHWVYQPGERGGGSAYSGYRYVQKTEAEGSYTPALNLTRMLRLGDPARLRMLLDAWPG
jgi:hypothetical protein